MAKRTLTTFQRALDDVADFSEQSVAVMPENPGAELLRYVAKMTGEDTEKLARLYAYFIAAGRLDGYAQEEVLAVGGFAEE